MKKNILKAVIGGFVGTALVAGLFAVVAPSVQQNADLVWPENSPVFAR
ncbi:hypothetical protein [Tumebacillus permanentifrigoris]|uniref:Uncharacterized protein n=1 Tax=Tumebacillus permanentifrigoris TaxID=378543 RepID=A0A316DB13_9BACL|nr:hypothetical protein [Tumebacillus permanentifrigoris]PWK14918.1 hypothetical protein C7459_104120 [Tumebacillus permanentifrigoris]